MVNLPSVFFVVVLICFCSVLFCLFLLIYLFIYLFFFFGGGGGSGSQFILLTTAFRISQFCGRNFTFNCVHLGLQGGGGVVFCDPPPPPNQELHLVLMLPYKYRLFNYFKYLKKLQRFMQDTYENTSFLSFSFLLNIRCCTQSICLKCI